MNCKLTIYGRRKEQQPKIQKSELGPLKYSYLIDKDRWWVRDFLKVINAKVTVADEARIWTQHVDSTFIDSMRYATFQQQSIRSQ